MTVRAPFHLEGKDPDIRKELVIQQMASANCGPPAWNVWLVISSLPGDLPGRRFLMTRSLLCCRKGKGGRSRLCRSHGRVGALVPCKRISACISGILVGFPVPILSGRTASEGVAMSAVGYFEAVKSV